MFIVLKEVKNQAKNSEIPLLTDLATPWSRVLLEKLRGYQLVKKFPALYGTRRFITAVASARHLSLSSASSIQSKPPHLNSWRSIRNPFTFLLTPWSRVLLQKLRDTSWSRNSPHFMEPESSLPQSQVPATWPYPQPAQFSPNPHIPIPEDLSEIPLLSYLLHGAESFFRS